MKFSERTAVVLSEPAVAPTMKKFSQPWSIVVLKPEAAPFMGIIRRAHRYHALFADFLRSFTPPGDVQASGGCLQMAHHDKYCPGAECRLSG
jgi:hypothetical protein